jgi:hypothetical protein
MYNKMQYYIFSPIMNLYSAIRCYWLNVILLLVSGLTIFMAGLGANFEYDL